MGRLLGILFAVLLGACMPGGAERASGKAPQASQAPPGAIRIGEDLYLVPLDRPVADCPAFRLYSPTKMVAQVIYHRAKGGGFTTDRNKADCR